MKLVTAVIRPHRVEAVKDALVGLGIEGMTVSEVRGHGRQSGHTETYRGTEYTVAFVPRTRVEVVCAAFRVEQVVDAIVDVAASGEVGDGKVWVTSVEEVVRIRTGDRGRAAL